MSNFENHVSSVGPSVIFFEEIEVSYSIFGIRAFRLTGVSFSSGLSFGTVMTAGLTKLFLSMILVFFSDVALLL